MTRVAILWDMDGTLLDSEPAHAAALHDATEELGLTVPDGFHDLLLGASDDRVHAALAASTGLDLTLSEWRAVKWGHYKRHAASIPLRHEVAAVALEFFLQGLPMAVVSNSTADEVALCLGAAGLSKLFIATVSRADVRRGKPDPEGYLLAARKLNVAPGCCIVVEDSPVGAQAGVAAGMRTFYLPQQPLAGQLVPQGAQYVAADYSRIVQSAVQQLRLSVTETVPGHGV